VPYPMRRSSSAAQAGGICKRRGRNAATRLEGLLRFAGLAAFRAATLAVLGSLAACGEEGPRTIEQVRERPATTAFKEVSTAERFGMSGGGHANPHHGMQASQVPLFEWTTPEGWEEKPPSKTRQADFRLSRDPETECYMSVLPGAAGGVGANVNRWRSQMGLEPLAPSALAALPQEKFLEGTAFVVDLEGTYVGMGQGEPKPGYRMLGLVAEQPGQTMFLKMTGPATTVMEERARFFELARSLRVSAAPEAPPQTDGTIAWTAPPEWEPRAGSPTRVVTLAPKGSTGTECYVTVLAGGAGGIGPNINRWREQMGQPPLGPKELGALETVKVLGRDARLIEIAGTFTDMQGNKVENAGLLGVVCPLEDAMLFVKMTGPSDVITLEKERFVAFCGSLRTP